MRVSTPREANVKPTSRQEPVPNSSQDFAGCIVLSPGGTERSPKDPGYIPQIRTRGRRVEALRREAASDRIEDLVRAQTQTMAVHFI